MSLNIDDEWENFISCVDDEDEDDDTTDAEDSEPDPKRQRSSPSNFGTIRDVIIDSSSFAPGSAYAQG